ncbi:hypothetical protein TanjilG_19585 [Lupinus angustifolius]|uniref:Peptidase S8/S53 domain-containing protein n=1 Tax=Lupinus angustifolius TaxID=3871 RepID=A0A1J7G9L8_LUPAN|nr:hypothetical protein TanjilG_19585 [Lupinus angustifolius]
MKGVSLSMFSLSSHELYPMIKASDANVDNVSSEIAAYCVNGNNLEPEKVKGKILVCIDSYFDQIWVEQTGVVGVIYPITESIQQLYLVPLMLPASNLNYADNKCFLNYINHTKSPTAIISKVETKLGTKPAPKLAVFSSRGHDPIEPRILKPDITVPGLNIIVVNAKANSPSGSTYNKRNAPFQLVFGTSMSCPHVSGLVVLLKALHCDWSSAAIKSAIMTTGLII